jgi:hypothetical protein
MQIPRYARDDKSTAVISADTLVRGAVGIAALLLLASAAFAQAITGTVKNGTTGKAAAGVDVILLNLGSGGMEEAARTKTDAQGKFSFSKDTGGQMHLLRALYQGVTYHKQLVPGSTSADVEVYEATKDMSGVGASVQVMRVQATQDTLQVIELYAVRNDLEPKKTINADQTFTITLPEGVQVDNSMAQAPGGMPIQAAPVPDGKQKGRYYYVYPLRPGETRFQLSYHLPYSGEYAAQIKPAHTLEHFVVITPKSMTFAPADASRFSAMGNEGGTNTQVATSVKAGETLAFKVGGTGEFPREQQAEGPAEGAAAAQGGGEEDTRPGGGLGKPSEAPDPLHQYRWYILAAIVVGLCATAFIALRRPATGVAAAAAPAAQPGPARAPLTAMRGNGNVSPASHGPLLLEALKEELFQLEIERQQERISADEYHRAKAALDVVIGRALARQRPATAKQV